MLDQDLKTAAHNSGLTVYRLAQLAGIPEPVAHKWLKNDADIRISTAAKIAKALHLELKPQPKKRP